LKLTQLPPHNVVPAPQTHRAPEHVAPAGHGRSQPPQCDGLLFVFVQIPLQICTPGSSGHEHIAEMQIIPPVHPLAQRPQLFSSEYNVTQCPLQFVVVAGHNVLHRANVHACPVRHRKPHIPQFDGSLNKLTQDPSQFACVAGHPQIPFWQDSPPTQAVPHAPQLRASALRFTQLRPQRTVPLGQLDRHIPDAHTWPVAHTRPHMPQLSTRLSVSVHTPAHRVCPGRQMHIPPLQMVPPVQRLSHMPQWSGSISGYVHVVPHTIKPLLHVTPQCPRLQTSPVAHTEPH